MAMPPGAVDRLAGPGRVGDRQRHGVLEVFVTGIGNLYFETGGRDAGVVRVAGDERVEGAQGDGAGELLVGEREGGDGKGALELHVGEVGKPAQRGARRAKAVAVQPGRAQAAGQRPGEVAVQHPRVHHLPRALSLYGEVAEAVDAALVGAVEDLPVDQSAVARQPDRAGTDPAERKRNLIQLGAAIGEVSAGGLAETMVAHDDRIVKRERRCGQARLARTVCGSVPRRRPHSSHQVGQLHQRGRSNEVLGVLQHLLGCYCGSRRRSCRAATAVPPPAWRARDLSAADWRGPRARRRQ